MQKYDLNIYERKDGRKQTNVTICGKRTTISGKTKEEIYKKYAKKLLKAGSRTLTTSETMKSYAVKWFKTEKEGKVSYNTEQRYRYILNYYIIPYIGDMRLSEIKQFHIQQTINQMENRAKSYQQKVIDTLKQIFDSAVINELVSVNPVIRINKSGKEPKEKEALSSSETVYLLNSVKEPRAKLFVYIAVFCGLRRGEIYALEWSDIDLNNNCIYITKSLCFEANKGYIKEPKSKAGFRTVPIPKELRQLLLKNKKSTGFVITDINGKMITKSSARRLWLNVMKSIQKPVQPDKPAPKTENEIRNNMLFYVSPHILRHTYCTNLYYAGVDLQTASKLMGHSSIEITNKIYTHIDNSYVNKANDKLNVFFGDFVNRGCEVSAKLCLAQ